MFDDEIQAWNYGPVIPVIYHKYKKDREPILYTSKNCSYEIFSLV
ncbi:MAG: type II toxin-antitoxin system antitoxin SocA domain-containing protein [Candidatus Ornithospirochaeta sp.]